MSVSIRLIASLLFCLAAASHASAQASGASIAASAGAAGAAPAAVLPAIPDFKTGVARKRYLFPQKEAQGANVLNVTKNTDEDAEKDGTYTRLSYLPYPLLLAQLAELRKMYYWADSTYQRRLTALPAGGALQLTIYRRGATNADPSLLVLQALTKAGQEVWRAAPRAGNGRFWNRDLYKSEQQLPFIKTADSQPLTVKIYDPHQGQTYEYVVQMP